MEQIVKKVETTSTITVYQAIDGTEFSSKEECLKYEGTVECLLLTKYNRLVKRRVSEDELFNTGSDECMIDILQPLSSEADIDIIIQSKNEIPADFFKMEKVGITAGASTPDEIIMDVKNKLCNLNE